MPAAWAALSYTLVLSLHLNLTTERGKVLFPFCRGGDQGSDAVNDFPTTNRRAGQASDSEAFVLHLVTFLSVMGLFTANTWRCSPPHYF